MSLDSNLMVTIMSRLLILWVVLSCLTEYTFATANVVYCISQRRNTSIICITFDEIIQKRINLLSHLTLIVDGQVELHMPLHFKNLWELSLIGRNEGRVSCFSNSGVSFYNVTGLTIRNLAFEHCSILSNSTSTHTFANVPKEKRTNWRYPTAVYIENCSDIIIENSLFDHNYGTGLSIYDPTDTVNIHETHFIANKINLAELDTYPGGGGLHIELTCCPPGVYCYHRYGSNCIRSYENKSIDFTVRGCIFENNTSTSIEDSNRYFTVDSGIYQNFGRGGGLLFTAERVFSFNLLSIINCTFKNNSAEQGGGMLIEFTGQISGYLLVFNCSFGANTGKRGGGGVYLQLSNTLHNTTIAIEFNNSDFWNNSADIGGGMILLDSGSYRSMNNTVLFSHCSWRSNSARYSAAFDLSRTERSSCTTEALKPRFVACSFIHNFVINKVSKIENSTATYTALGKATFMALYFTLVFEADIYFEDNVGSALYLISSSVNFSSGITAVFRRNYGIRGGAFSLHGSFITINPNSTFDIYNNTASSVGGAIYFSSIGEHDLHDHINICMFDIDPIEFKNVEINFSGNRQQNEIINSIYTSSQNECVKKCTNGHRTLITSETLLQCTSIVHFDNRSSLQIQGPGTNIAADKKVPETFEVYPGIKYELPFYLTDEMKNKQSGSFLLEVISGDIQVDEDYILYSVGTHIKLLGKSGKTARIRLRRKDQYFEVAFDVKLLPCPPGLRLDNDGRGNKCVCGLNGTSIYHHIICSTEGQRALLVSGYWAGYIANSKPEPENFYTSKCPLGFCQYSDGKSGSLNNLPQKLVSKEKLNTFVCGSTRTGVLCGDCVKGHSVYYHSPTLECKKDTSLCKIGWLFYVVSELLPLTVIFVIIIVFNIKFTSGLANGFIFYSQVVSTLVFISSGTAEYVQVLLEIHLFIYHFFNMEFFSYTYLSFCLWKGATTLDIVAFSYLTIIYAFLLITFTIFLMKYCSCCLTCTHQQNSTSYAIHGLSTFLIMCYLRCTWVSLQILTSCSPLGVEQVYSKRRRVYFSGSLEYFDDNHVIYAIPALACITVIVVTPPIILLWYPLGPKLFQLCGFGDSKALRLFNKLVPFHKLQPLLDSFQSCYRDECRFFSGLYFLYRTSILATFASVTSFNQFYTSVQILLVVMLLVHAIAQPYKNWWHNVSDALLIALMSAINALSSYILNQQVHPDKTAKMNVFCASVIQLILVCLPLISMLMYIASKVIVSIRAKCRNENDSNEADELIDFPARLIYSDEYSFDNTNKDNRCKSPYIQND